MAGTTEEQRRAEVRSMLDKYRQDAVTAAKNAKSSFTGRLLANVVDNLVLHFSDIRLVFVDQHTLLASSVAAELRLDAFSVDTANQEWEPVDFAVSDQETRKLLSLTGLAVHWQRPSSDAAQADAPTTYLLEPVSLTGQVCYVKADAVSKNVPVVSLALEVDQLRFDIDELIVRDIAALLESGQQSLMPASPYDQHHPKPVKGKWRDVWQWAIAHVQETLRQQRSSSWHRAGLIEAALRGVEYAQLFKRGLGLVGLPGLCDAELTRMADLAARVPTAFLADVRRSVVQSMQEEVVGLLGAGHEEEAPARGLWARMLGVARGEPRARAEGAREGEGQREGGLRMSGEERAGLEAMVEAAGSAEARQQQVTLPRRPRQRARRGKADMREGGGRCWRLRQKSMWPTPWRSPPPPSRSRWPRSGQRAGGEAGGGGWLGKRSCRRCGGGRWCDASTTA
eukprot:60538-Rhodomonas_salina.2